MAKIPVLLVDFDLRRIQRGSRHIQLAPRCWPILELLVIRKGTVPHRELIAAGWKQRVIRENKGLGGALREVIHRLNRALKGYARITADGRPARGYTLNEEPVMAVVWSGQLARLRPGKLPEPEHRLVGRRDEIKTIRAALDSNRLVTLVGPSGMGKTHLAIEFCSSLGDSKNICFLNIDRLESTADLLTELAAALRVRKLPGNDPEDLIVDVLEDTPTIIVLDECDQLSAGCAALVSKILSKTHRCRFLATSQAPLSIHNHERCISVLPFAVPSLAQLPKDPARRRDRLQQCEAIQLFTTFAATFAPEIGLDDQLEDILDLCRLLDGSPAGLLQAAAHVRNVPDVRQLISFCDLLLTTSPQPGRSARHDRIWPAMLEASMGLLPPDAYSLFLRLSVFRGNLKPAMILAVCSDDKLDSNRIVLALAELCQRSLIRPYRRPEGPFYLGFSAFRRLAWDRLRKLRSGDRICDRHAILFADMVLELGKNFRGRDEGRALNEIEAYYDDVIAALDWLVSSPRKPSDECKLLRFAATLSHLWVVRGRYAEGFRWLERVLKATARTKCRKEYAMALAASATMLARTGNLPAAEKQFRDVFSKSRTNADRARSLHQVGVILIERVHHKEATVMLNKSLALRKKGKPPDEAGIAATIDCLGIIDAREHRFKAAYDRFRASLKIREELGDNRAIATTLNNLGDAAFKLKRVDEALAAYRASLELRASAGDLVSIAESLESFAELVQARNPVKATLFWAAAGRIRKEIGAPWLPNREGESGPLIERLKATLPNFEAHWKHGESMEVEDVVELGIKGQIG